MKDRQFNPYKSLGYANRDDYLRDMADEYGVSFDTVETMYDAYDDEVDEDYPPFYYGLRLQ